VAEVGRHADADALADVAHARAARAGEVDVVAVFGALGLQLVGQGGGFVLAPHNSVSFMESVEAGENRGRTIRPARLRKAGLLKP
jgi:hypothetical protein